jgi:hypothetical protein
LGGDTRTESNGWPSLSSSAYHLSHACPTFSFCEPLSNPQPLVEVHSVDVWHEPLFHLSSTRRAFQHKRLPPIPPSCQLTLQPLLATMYTFLLPPVAVPAVRAQPLLATREYHHHRVHTVTDAARVECRGRVTQRRRGEGKGMLVADLRRGWQSGG